MTSSLSFRGGPTADEESVRYSRSLQMDSRYLSETCIPDNGTKNGARKGCVRLLSITLPPLTMREVERVCGDVRRPVLVFRSETEFEPSPAEKVCPTAAVMHESRFREQSASDDEVSAKRLVLSSEGLITSVSCLPPEKSDRRSDNMTRSVFTEDKDTHYFLKTMPKTLWQERVTALFIACLSNRLLIRRKWVTLAYGIPVKAEIRRNIG